MPALATTLLEYKITANGKQAKAEIKDVDGLINKLGAGSNLKSVLGAAESNFGSLSGAAGKAKEVLGSIPIPAAAAATAVAGIGYAAYAAGNQLFDMAKAGSDL